MLAVSFFGFWNGFIPENFIIYKALKDIESEIKLIDNPYEEETDLVIVDFSLDLEPDKLKGYPKIIQYSGESSFNVTYRYNLLVGNIFNSIYSCYLPYCFTLDSFLYQLAEPLPEITKEEVEKRGFCSFVGSNPVELRRKYFNLINDNIGKVDSGGRFLNNIGRFLDWGSGKLDFIRNYNFNLAIENTKCEYYITEKIIEAFNSRTIPIYYGSKYLINEFVNKNAFINITDMNDTDIINLIKKCNNVNYIVDTLNTYQPIIFNKSYFEETYNNLVTKIKNTIS